MNILAALRQAESKLQKQASVAQQQLDALRAAMKILGRDVASGGKRIGRKKRVMSAAARARISKATKERWPKFRAARAKGKHWRGRSKHCGLFSQAKVVGRSHHSS